MSKNHKNKKDKPKKKKGGSKKHGGDSNPSSGSSTNGAVPQNSPSNPNENPKSSISDDFNKPNWLKKAIDFIRKKKILTGILAIIAAAGTFIAIIPYLEKGKFEATINGEALDSSTINRTYLVFFDKESANLMKFKEFPRIFNSSRYALTDLNLKYKIYADSLTAISYRRDYHTEDSPDDEGMAYTEVIYSKDKIMQSDTIPLPFRSFKMKDKAEARIELTATYSGYKTPFNYCANIYTKRIYQENKSNPWESVYNEALSFLESKNDIDKFDLRYIDKEILPEHNNLTADWLREEIASYNPSLEDSTEMVVDSSWYEYDGTIYPTQEEIVKSEYFYRDSLGNVHSITYKDGNKHEVISYRDSAGNEHEVIVVTSYDPSTGDSTVMWYTYEGTIYPTQEEIVMNASFTNTHTPWYMYIVAILLGIVFLVGMSITIRRILHYNKYQNTLLFVIEIIVTGFLSYIALMLSLRILFVTFQETGFLWAPLALLYIMLFGLLIITSLFEKDDKDRYRPYNPYKDIFKKDKPELQTINRNHNVTLNSNKKHMVMKKSFGINNHSESINNPKQIIITIIWAVFIAVISIIISRIF